MEAALATRIERTFARTAAAMFGLAIAYAASMLLGASASHPQIFAEGAGVGAIAYLAAGRVLARIARRPALTAPPFEVRAIETEREPELLLTEVHEPVVKKEGEPLVLDDILAELDPDSRVVRLFDRSAMPTPGQLKSQIDAHLGRTAEEDPSPDASQALHDALAELRRAIG